MPVVLDIQNVSVRLPHVSKSLLTKIKYHVHAGDFVIVLGSNGSGKSSLLKVLNRSLMPTAGHIKLCGKNIAEYSAKQFSQEVVLLTQQSDDSLFGSLTVFENYLLIATEKKTKTQHQKVLRNYLAEFNANLPNKLDHLAIQLSGGEKQALLLALYTLSPPKILLLDEHTSALDPNASEHIMELTAKIIANNNLSCIMTTHNIDIALRYGNRILALREGEVHQLIEDKDKLASSPETLLRACY